MFKLKGIDHVAVCVPDVDEAAAPWRAFLAAFGGFGAAGAGAPPGLPAPVRELVASQRAEVLLLAVDARACIELVAPKGNDGLERFLAKRGPGLHHIAFAVDGIEDAISALKSMGVEMIDDAPRIGARGHMVAFVHPGAFGGVLVELVQREGEGERREGAE